MAHVQGGHFACAYLMKKPHLTEILRILLKFSLTSIPQGAIFGDEQVSRGFSFKAEESSIFWAMIPSSGTGSRA
jgi:hypothetical protein